MKTTKYEATAYQCSYSVIFNPEYKLNQFDQANGQELIGWISKGDLPIIIDRTTKILRYFGSNVQQLN